MLPSKSPRISQLMDQYSFAFIAQNYAMEFLDGVNLDKRQLTVEGLRSWLTRPEAVIL